MSEIDRDLTNRGDDYLNNLQMRDKAAKIFRNSIKKMTINQSATVVTRGYRKFTLCTSQCVPS